MLYFKLTHLPVHNFILKENLLFLYTLSTKLGTTVPYYNLANFTVTRDKFIIKS